MQTILFTGARSGIASHVIEKIKDKDFHIIVAVHNQKQLQLVMQSYQNNANITCIKLDVTSAEDRKQLEKLDIDILVSNAAIGVGGSMMEVSMDRVRDNFEINVFGYFEVIQIVLKNMMKKKKGKLINMSSLAGIISLPFLGSYCATKASIIRMTEAFYLENKLLNNQIQISLIEPGLYHTGFNQVMLENKYPSMYQDSYFDTMIDWIRKRENLLVRLSEKKYTDSIVRQIVKAIESNQMKRVYRAPFGQVFFSKLYQVFWG